MTTKTVKELLAILKTYSPDMLVIMEPLVGDHRIGFCYESHGISHVSLEKGHVSLKGSL